jgi:uncharacterized protein YjbJ (UPF0337 family)
MKNRDELDGKSESIKGKVEQAAGDLTDNEELRERGAAHEISGKTRETFGRARRKVGEALDDLADVIKR